MIIKNRLKFGLVKFVFGLFLIMMGLVTGVVGVGSQPVFAEENEPVVVTTEEIEKSETVQEEAPQVQEESSAAQEETSSAQSVTTRRSRTDKNCKDSLGAIGWLVCPTTGKIAEAVDWLYDKIEDVLVINPVPREDGTPMYEIWKYCRGLTNILFIIFLLVVIYSQITGHGINNYGVKKALPKLIVAAVMVNLSFLICSLAVDVSNVVGNGLRGVFSSVAESAVVGSNAATASGDLTREMKMSYASMYSSIAGGTALTIGAATIALETGTIWMLIPTVLGAIVAVVIGLITIALRQAVVALLIMISPLAVVANILPNTEGWFKKWKDLLYKMLIFYPMFSLLFGASQLAGFAIIASAKDGFVLLLGMAVQIYPLFAAWKLMQMSDTFLGDINAKLRGFMATPLANNRAWADSRKQITRLKHLNSERVYSPSLRLMQFMSNRRITREEDIAEETKIAQLRGRAYRAQRNWKGAGATGAPTRRGEKAYEEIAQSLEYQRVIERDKNTLTKGLGKYADGSIQKSRLDDLDARMVKASDALKVELARGEKIEYNNAVSFHKRMQDAINAHLDLTQGFDENGAIKSGYKFHFDPNNIKNTAAMARYNTISQIMEGNAVDAQYAAAVAAHAFDTQQKMHNSRMQTFYNLTPTSKDVTLMLNELTKVDLKSGETAVKNIDAILSAMRILNFRGDTDILKEQMDNVLDKTIGGGMTLGTQASQALASFLMFEVKDSDPFLRRFGKYINIETAEAYSNKRKEMYVDYDEYLKGCHTEPDGTIMYAKKPFKKLIEGTSLDNIERTALASLDDSLKKAYGFGYDKNGKVKDWDVEGYLKKREEVQTAFEPAFISASLKWMSGSEQINSGIRFWTGYELKQQKDKDGNLIVDENKDPVYGLSPIWEGKEFAGHKDEVKRYFRRKTRDYIKDQTTGQILNMRSDYRDPTKAHMLDMYLNGLKDDSEMTDKEKQEYSKRRAEYNKRKSEIQTRYNNKTADEAARLRKRDMADLDMEFSGRQIRSILGESGKLRQIYRTRTSGTAINAKDWLRKWVNLDNEEALRKEVEYYQDQKERHRKKESPKDEASGVEATSRVYDDDFKNDFKVRLDEFNQDTDGLNDEEFYESVIDFLRETFGNDNVVVSEFERYKTKEHRSASRQDMLTKIIELLNDLD